MTSCANRQYYIGVDVGTGSARAGVFSLLGKLLASAQVKIEIYREGSDIVEQSSDNIWSAVCQCVQQALTLSGISRDDIGGIGFDATCSLVVLDPHGEPLTISANGDNGRNIIVWMDHRAKHQADRINGTGHEVLKYVGGRMSPEMQPPKLLWLQENLADTFDKAGYFFDLPDFLTWRATGDAARSSCTVTCKWTYLGHEKRWDESFFNEVGLGELTKDDFRRIGSQVVDVGTSLGNGLTIDAAAQLGLNAGTPVGAALIDAHAGGVGTIGAKGGDPCDRLAYVFGTSACTMSSSKNASFVPGVWGPYYSAMVPGLWLNEGGQSAAGEAIAFVLKMHPIYQEAKAHAAKQGLALPDYLLSCLREKESDFSHLIKRAGQVVVVPEFLGNRAPFADPDTKAIIAGLDLDESIDSLLALYIAGITGIGYGLKQILIAQSASGLSPDTVVMSGGAGADPIVKQLLADSAGITVAEAGTEEPVLLGSAIIGAVAGRAYSNIYEGMSAMSSLGRIFRPSIGEIAERHNVRFRSFEALQNAAKLVRGESDG